MDRGVHTQQEIFTQPEAWAEALEVVEQARPGLEKTLGGVYEQVIFSGCGSTYYLSLAAAALFQESTGRIARAVPGGELLLNGATALTGGKTLLVAVSRSGSTTETVRAVEQFKQQGRGPVVAITNYGGQPLAGLGDVALVIPKGQEQSVAQTRSFASLYAASAALALLAGGRGAEYQAMRALPGVGEKLLAQYAPLARQVGENLTLDRFYFLGSGMRYGLACEVNLKMKEMTLTHSEPFHFLEFRHGPMSMVNGNAMVVGFLSEKDFVHEQAVLDEMQALGGRVLSVGETGTAVSFDSGIPEAARGVLYLPVLQMMAFYRSLAKGLDPDRPTHLSAVVKLNF
jgi:glucosamine--fructose-6-phosphate aminotransferase (isomerizing)